MSGGPPSTMPRKLLLASTWAFEESGVEEFRKEVEDPEYNVRADYQASEHLFVIEGTTDKDDDDFCAELMKGFIDRHRHGDLLDVPRIRQLEKVKIQDSTQAPRPQQDLLGLDDDVDEGRDQPAPAPAPEIITQIWEPSIDLGYFTTDKFGILPRLAAATDTEIAVVCLGDGTIQISVSGTSAGDVEATIAKLATLEKSMSLVERPDRGIIFIDTTDGKPSGYRIVPYSDLNPKALKRVLVDPDSIEAEEIPGLFAPVLYGLESKTASWVPPRNISSPPRVDANESETIKTWEDCQFPEIGNGESFSGFTATNQLVLYRGPISAAETSPPHPFLSLDKAQQVDDWVDDSTTALAPEPRDTLSARAHAPTRTEEQPATQPGPSAAEAKSESLDCKSEKPSIKRPQRLKTRAVFVRTDTTSATNPGPNNSANTGQNPPIGTGSALESAPQDVEVSQNLIQLDGPSSDLKTKKKTREPINLPGNPLPASQLSDSDKPHASFGTGHFASVNSTQSQTLLDLDDDDASVNVADSKNANEDLAGLEFDRPSSDHTPSLGGFSFPEPARPAQQNTSLLDLDIKEPASALPIVGTEPMIPMLIPLNEETALIPFNRDLLPKGMKSSDLDSPSVQLPPVIRTPSPTSRQKNDAVALEFLKRQIVANPSVNAGSENGILKINPPTSRPVSAMTTEKTASDIVHESPAVDWRTLPVVLHESAGNNPMRHHLDREFLEAPSGDHEKREDKQAMNDETQSHILHPQALKKPSASRPDPPASRPIEPREVTDRPGSLPTTESLYERARKDNESWEARRKAESLRNRAREQKQSAKALPKTDPLQGRVGKEKQSAEAHFQQTKAFFDVLKPVLDASRCYPGALSLEFQLGLILVPPLSHTYKAKSLNLEQLQRTFLPKRGLPAPATTHFNRLTASPADIDHIIDIQIKDRRLFESNATDCVIKYEFHCETKQGDLLITIDASGEAEMGVPSQLLGSVHISFPGHVWDAAAVIQGHMKHGLGLGPEIEEAAQFIVTNLWVAPNRTRVRLFTRAPKDHLSIKKILLKRYSQYRYLDNMDLKGKGPDHGLRLKVTETQDLPIIRHPIGRNIIEASCGPLDEMVKANRQWWEVSLVSPIINTFLGSNELLQPGESPDWSFEDLLGNEKGRVCDETLSPFAASIDRAGIGSLLRLIKEVVTNIDAVGYWNGAVTTSPAAGVPLNVPGSAVIVPPRTETSLHSTVQPLALVPYAGPAAPSPEKSLRSVESTQSPFW